MPAYIIPQDAYDTLSATRDYKMAVRSVGFMSHVIPALRKKLRSDLARANKNREKWHKNTVKFKIFLETQRKIITGIRVEEWEIDFLFIKEQCQKVVVNTISGEYTFTISLDYAKQMINSTPNDERSVATVAK